MVWNGRVSVHDFYETTRIFYKKDDFSISDTGDSEEKNPSFPKADLDGMIFAYDYRAGLACVMTSQQIVLSKLDPLHSYDTLWMS